MIDRALSFRRGFTLIEIMVAVIVMGLLCGAVVLTFAGPIRRARMTEAIEQVKYADASARDVARRFGREVELVFDLSASRIERCEQGGPEATFAANVPPPMRIEAVRTREGETDYGQASVAISPVGLSPTYAVKIAGPEGTRWILVTGLGGVTVVLANEAQVERIFAATDAAARHDAH